MDMGVKKSEKSITVKNLALTYYLFSMKNSSTVHTRRFDFKIELNLKVKISQQKISYLLKNFNLENDVRLILNFDWRRAVVQKTKNNNLKK